MKDQGQLESVLVNVQNDLYYPTFLDKLTHLVFLIIQFHMFIDGNKRTSVATGAVFLRINEYELASKVFTPVIEDVVVKVASGQLSKTELKDIIQTIITKTT